LKFIPVKTDGKEEEGELGPAFDRAIVVEPRYYRITRGKNERRVKSLNSEKLFCDSTRKARGARGKPGG